MKMPHPHHSHPPPPTHHSNPPNSQSIDKLLSKQRLWEYFMACLTNNFTKQLVDYHRKVDKNREEGERDCLHKHQVPLVTHILLCYIINFCLPAERSRCRDKLYSLYIIHVQAVLKSNIFPLTVTALLHSRQSMNFNRKDYISYIPQHLVGMDKCMNNLCKWRA